jgi:hypothetical protein
MRLPGGGPNAVATACSVIEAELRSGHVALRSANRSEGPTVACSEDYSLDLERSSGLRRATALRVDVGSLDRLAWVLLEMGTPGAPELALWGPCAAAVVSKIDGAANDVVTDLQPIDVLPGGSPEVVVKMMSLRTEPDLALNELLEVDETRAVLLTTDRGQVESSRELSIASRIVRRMLAPKDRTTLSGYPASAALGEVTSHQMKVAWGRPNTIVLTKTEGVGPPPPVDTEGEITLFP